MSDDQNSQDETPPSDPSGSGPATKGGGGGIADMLVRQGLVSEEQIQDAKDQTKQQGGGLTGALAKLGYVKETQLVEFLSRQYGVPSINLEEVEVDEEVIQLVPREVAERHQVIPIEKQGQTLIVALTDPSNIYAMDDIKFLTGFNVEVVVTSEASIESALEQYYAPGGEFEDALEGYDEDEIDFLTGDQGVEDFEDLEDEAEEAPVVRLVNVVLVDAIKRGCSDIHVEPYEKEFRIRYRIDGVLYNIMNPPMRLKNAITSRLKIMSELDIAERRLPQDGRIKLVLGGGKEVDFRVSVLPTLFGEKVVLRILDKSNLQLDMTKLGFEQHQLEPFLHAVHQPFGMVLVTGPTGSGKTTTLYSALQDLNKVSENISTAEDPVEFNMAGINQCQMKDDIGLNFAAALRSFLRQDPDIIMVGEIRDFETGEIAIKAALTGHLVLSTLHTNDAPSTINRMLNMGIEPFMITSSLNAIVAQRLARRICKECAEPLDIDKATLVDIGLTEEQIAEGEFMKGSGCSVCNNTGFKGRVALYEIMIAGDEIKEAVLGGYSAMELKQLAIKCGMQTLRMSGNKKLCEGTTTVSEVLRTTRADNA
jgi:type IV pilus assembly protein PilB